AGSGPQAQTPVVAEPPKPALPVAQPTPAPQPTPAVLAPVPSVPERGRRVAKPHGSRAASAVGSSAPVQRGKKSKADDTVAPSPYQSDD
ncbi:MAG: hypothetical protein WBP56_19285, partial [Polyangia bacterium]